MALTQTPVSSGASVRRLDLATLACIRVGRSAPLVRERAAAVLSCT